MKLLVSFFMIFGAFFCCEKQDFTVISARSQNFAGGTVWSPSGTNYSIVLKAERNLVNVRFLAVWTGQKRYTGIEAQCNGQNVEFSDISKGETISVSFTALRNNRPVKNNDENAADIPDPADAAMFGDDTKPPVEFSGVALVCFLEKGKKKFLEIQEFEKLPAQMRP
jgi:hypothetical protein